MERDVKTLQRMVYGLRNWVRHTQSSEYGHCAFCQGHQPGDPTKELHHKDCPRMEYLNENYSVKAKFTGEWVTVSGWESGDFRWNE